MSGSGAGSGQEQKPSGESILTKIARSFVKFERVSPPSPKPGVEAVEPADLGPSPTIRAAVTVAQENPAQFHEPVAHEGELATVPFERIYTEGGINSKYTIDDFEKLVNRPDIKTQPIQTRSLMVNLALSMLNLTIEEPIADAMRRDDALDAYQHMLTERAAKIEQESNAGIAAIEAEINEFLSRKKTEVDALREQAQNARQDETSFKQRREVEETRFSELIRPYLEAGRVNPITIGDAVRQKENKEGHAIEQAES